MSIVPASYLSSSDLVELGNNVLPAVTRDRIDVAAVNRSLAPHAERVTTLFAPRGQQIPRGRRTRKAKTVTDA